MEEYLSEKEKWEWIKGWLRQNIPWILAGIAVGAAGVGGWRWYLSHVDQRGQDAGALYQQVVEAFGKGDRTNALVNLGKMEREYPSSPYVDQAKLLAARVYVDSGELDKAHTELQNVIEHTQDQDLGLITRLRLARVQIAQQKPDDAIATLGGIPDPGAFAPRYHEVRGDAYHAKGDNAAALQEYQAARTGDLSGVTDTQTLDLKITDLLADTRAPGSLSSKQPSAAAAAK
jgi:predicted negative regulator of RcsB-dependent stress response